jgi:LysM repeat protein
MGSFVGAAQRHGRKLKLMRSGRHATPSQVEKVAEKAGKAAPAMAISAGALMAVPHGHAASAAKHTTVAESSTPAKAFRATSAQLDSVTRPAQPKQESHTYTVQAGDTLSKISQQVYGKTADWPWIYHENASQLKDPNLIYPGQKLNTPADPPAHFNFSIPAATSNYAPKHAAPAQTSDNQSQGSVTVSASVGSSSTYTGGTPGGAFGACVVERESGGDSQVMNASGHYGLYQFSESTWVAYGGNAADFGHASVAEQNQVFANALAQGGESNWAPYDGC